MDAHFREYLAAITGMADVYGESGDDCPTEFHDAASMLADAALAGQKMASDADSTVASVQV